MSATVELVAPAYQSVPPHSTTAGPEVADLADAIGLPLDPEQRLALDLMFAENGDRLAALEFAIVAPRQNIKTHLFKAAAWGDLLLFDQNLVVWSAHEFNTAMEAFRDMEELADGSPLISRRIKKISHENGGEGIEFMSGQRLRFKARTKGGGRGITGDRVFLDEWFAGQAAHLGSLLPTLAAKSMTGDPQVRYGSSAGLVGSEMLRRLRDRGRSGTDPGLVYLEWCAPEGTCTDPNCTHLVGAEGCALDDLELIGRANLALGRRISVEFVQTMRLSMPAEEFAREFLGWWDEPAGDGAGITAEQWAACADREAVIAEPCALAVDVSPGHLSGAIAVAGGAVHLAEHHPGTSWIVPSLLNIVEEHTVTAVGIDPTGPAGALLPDLERAGFVIRTPKTPKALIVSLDGREAAQACEAFLADVVAGKFVHRDQGALGAAVAAAGRRQVGDTWKWSRRDSTVDISPLVAATAAHWLDVQKRRPSYTGPLIAYR